MKDPHRYCLLIFVVILLSGCASERLQLRLDIYKETPELPTLTDADVVKMFRNIDSAESAAQKSAGKRIEIARGLTGFYEALVLAGGGTTNDAGLINTRGHLLTYEQKIDQQLERVRGQAQVYRKAVQQYAKSKQDADLPLIWEALHDLEKALKGLTGPLDTDFENGFEKFFRTFHGNLQALPDDVSEQSLTNLRQQFSKLQESLGALVEEGSQNMALIKAHTDLLNQAIAAKDGTTLKKQLPAGSPAGAPVRFNLAPDMTASLKRAVDQLDPAKEWFDLERSQDPTDPVWRVITDPANSRKWNTAFATNYFYAEGNSGIIVVRDTPIRYRVQRANNNPAALVQSQLQITRAVASAAIQVAGAASGIKVPVSLPGSQAGAPPSTPASTLAASENSTGQKAALEERARVRESAIRYLRGELASLQQRLSAPGLTPDNRKKLVREIKSLMEGVKPLFEPKKADKAKE